MQCNEGHHFLGCCSLLARGGYWFCKVGIYFCVSPPLQLGILTDARVPRPRTSGQKIAARRRRGVSQYNPKTVHCN